MSLTVALALSGLGSDNFWGGEFEEFYKKSAMLFPNGIPKSPSVSSIASATSTSSRYSSESGISSMPDSDISYLALEALIDNVFDEEGFKVQQVSDFTSKYQKKEKVQEKNKPLTVMYQGRDLLDLYANISKNWYGSNSAVLGDGIGSFYFENRSQYSRLQGASPPPHTNLSCPECSFTESKYD